MIGFVGGYMIADGDGPATVVAQGTTETAEPAPPPAETAPTTVTAEEEPPPPEPASVAVAVLNGTGLTGLAAQTAEQLAGLGYEDVSTGNAPAAAGATTVYYRPGAEAAAATLAEDAGAAGGTAPLPASGELADAVPADAQVALVLGPG